MIIIQVHWPVTMLIDVTGATVNRMKDERRKIKDEWKVRKGKRKKKKKEDGKGIKREFRCLDEFFNLFCQTENSSTGKTH